MPPTKLSESPQSHKGWHRSARSYALRPAADAKSIVGSLHSRDWYSRLLACGMDYGSATYQ